MNETNIYDMLYIVCMFNGSINALYEIKVIKKRVSFIETSIMNIKYLLNKSSPYAYNHKETRLQEL